MLRDLCNRPDWSPRPFVRNRFTRLFDIDFHGNCIILFFFSFFLSLLLRFIVAVIETHFVGDTRSWSDFRTSIVSFTARDPVLCRRACARSRIGKISWSAARFVGNGLSTNTFREKSPRIDKSSLINSRTLPFLETLE